MMLGVVRPIPDAEDPGGIVSRLMDAVPPGSYLAIPAVTNDFEADKVNQATGGFNSLRVAARITCRTRAAVSRYFDGLDLVDPGLVPIAHLPRAGRPGEAGNDARGRRPATRRASPAACGA
jgi:S-adenosyl methyltransferase